MKPICLFILLALAAIVSAQMPPNEPPKVAIKPFNKTLRPSDKFFVTLEIKFAPGMSAYQNPPSDPMYIPLVVAAADKSTTVLSVQYPPGANSKVGGESKPTKVYMGTILVKVLIQAPKNPGNYPLKLRVSYQQCNESACFPPGEVDISTVFAVKKPVPVPTRGPGG